MTQSAWILLAFALYLLMMLGIGAICFKKSKDTTDYFLGGRGLGAWVAALSAQASDMSGWLLMGLPGAIYAAGTGEAWIGVGLALGTALNWIITTRRLRRYSLVTNAVTLPEFFQNRFHDKSRSLRVLSSVVLLVFFTVYIASAFSAGAKLFSAVFGISYTLALVIGAVVIVCYTFLGGFLAVCWTDFIQGMLMLAAILAVPIIAVCLMPDFAGSLAAESAAIPGYLDPIKGTNAVGIISNLGWGLGYFGMPHIIVRFMAIRSDKEVSKSRIIGIVWVVLSLGAAVLAGVVGRAYLGGDALTGGDTEKVFIQTILKLFTEHWYIPLLAGILLCGILAAVMSTADSQLLVASSSFADDLVSSFSKKKISDKIMLRLSRITVLVVAAIAFVFALDPNSSVMQLVSNAWAGFGAAFGPMVLLSLFWKRINTPGAFAGIFSGAATVILWDYIPVIKTAEGAVTIGTYTGLYSLVVGFAVSLLFIFLVSIITKKPSDEIIAEFELAASSEEIIPAAEETATEETATEESTTEESTEEAAE